jgi:hypothetical protein
MLCGFSASRTSLTQKKKKEKKESADRGNGMRKCKVFCKKILPDFKDGLRRKPRNGFLLKYIRK